MHLVMPVHPSLPRTCHLGLPAHSLVSFSKGLNLEDDCSFRLILF